MNQPREKSGCCGNLHHIRWRGELAALAATKHKPERGRESIANNTTRDGEFALANDSPTPSGAGGVKLGVFEHPGVHEVEEFLLVGRFQLLEEVAVEDFAVA